MTGWQTMEPNQPELRRRMRYDGLGRLDLYESYQSGGTRDAVEYRYTADNLLVEEARWTGMQVNRILRFSGARYETDTGELLEEILPMLRLKDGGDGKWVFLDLDGHALAVFDDGGAEETFELAGVYGAKLDPAPGLSPLDYFQGQDWKLDGLHGVELDRSRGLVHRGQRHAMLDDGRWLQPEPLLAAGIQDADFGRPSSLGSVYAGGNPIIYADNTGYYFESALDIASLAAGAVSFVSNVKDGNTGAAAVDAVGMALDAAALALPGVPGGAGLAVKALRYGDEAVPIAAKAAGALAKTDNVTDAGNAAKAAKCALNCFVADTQVVVPAGSSSIEEVAPGDEVLAYDPASEGDWIPIEAEPGPDPSACDPESDPECEKQVVPAAEEVSDVE